jgi:hypothetical protein
MMMLTMMAPQRCAAIENGNHKAPQKTPILLVVYDASDGELADVFVQS